MHGVKKTPASEAQLAAKRKERNEKLEVFLGVRNMIFEKREKNELDEQLLGLTAEILKKNPDIYTFWNIRRDILGLLTTKQEDETDEAHRERLKATYDKELELTLKGIQANPKSYSSWYHRGWTLQHHPEPNLKADLDLCEKSLSYQDCRNFHCWDHRRVVARMAGLDANEELDFSNRLIKLNPSNYSAWHYRGTLLQRMHQEASGDTTTKRLLDDNVVSKELETVKNVCAYNSEDQTAWTYCRWLCEALCTKVENVPVLVHAVLKSQKSVSLTFSCAVTEEMARSSVKFEGNDFKLEKVSKVGTPSHRFCMVHQWTLTSATDDLNGLHLRLGAAEFQLPEGGEFFHYVYLQEFYSLGSRCETEEARQALAGVVEMCEGLMKEEEDIPWEVLILARMLPLLEGYKPEVVSRVHELLSKTIELDPQRRQVYEAMQQRVKRAKALKSEGEENPRVLYEYFRLSKSLD